MRQIEDMLEPLTGDLVRSIQLEPDAVFGLTGGPETSSWTLWIGGSWRLEKEDNLSFIGAKDDQHEQDAALQQLVGQRLQSFSTTSPMGDSAFEFGLARVRVFSRSSSGMPHWLLRLPDGHELTFGPGTSWSYE